MDAVGAVAPEHVVANDRPVAAVGDVDAVLDARPRALVVLDQQVVAEAGEDAPVAVLVAAVVADDDAVLSTERMPARGMPTTVKPSIVT